MKRVAYIEIDTHAEIVRNFKDLMDDSKKFSVDYYFSDKVLDTLDLEPSHQVFRASSDNLYDLLYQKKYDLVIIGTVHRYFNLFLKVVQNFPSVIIAHNLNFIQASRWDLLKNTFRKDVKFRLKLFLKEGLWFKNKVYENAKVLLVLDSNLAKNQGIKKINYFPIFFNKFDEVGQDNIFRVVIPGSVSQSRRDYRAVIKELEYLKIGRKVEFIFLGQAKGKKLGWLENLEKKLPQNIKIQYFKNKLPQDVFDDWMKKANLLWCPIQREIEFLGIKEIYGETKMSGGIGDAIKFAKMAIFPKNYSSELFFVKNENQSIANNIKNFQMLNKNEWKIFEKNNILVELEEIIYNFVEIKKLNE